MLYIVNQHYVKDRVKFSLIEIFVFEFCFAYARKIPNDQYLFHRTALHRFYEFFGKPVREFLRICLWKLES